MTDIIRRDNSNLTPEVLQGDASQVISFWSIINGEYKAPVSPTATVFMPGGAATAIVNQACTVTDTYKINCALNVSDTSAWPLLESYWIRFSYTVAGVTPPFKPELLFDVVMRQLQPYIPITAEDLKGADINIDTIMSQAGKTNDVVPIVLQKAWNDVYRWLKSKGRRPYLISDRNVLYGVTHARALYWASFMLMKKDADKAQKLMDRFEAMYEKAKDDTVLEWAPENTRQSVKERGFQQIELGTGPDHTTRVPQPYGALISTMNFDMMGRRR